MPLIPLFSGDYYCSNCDLEFDAERLREDELICPKCRKELSESDNDEDDAEDDDD